MLAVGDAAPDFAVGKTTLFKILRSREAVVFFFPKAFTPGWTREAGGFRREYASLREAGAEVIGVSADDQETADRFAASLELPFPVVGDPGGDVLNAFGVRIPVLGLARRVTFVVGKDRKVRAVHASQFDAESHAAQACSFVRKR